VRLWLASGDQASAVAWANQIPIKATRDPRQEIDLLTVARVRLAERNYAEAHHILETLDQFPGIEKRINRKIKISLLLACALAGQNRIPQAIQILETYLNLAEPEGLIRVFVDAGKPMQELLKLYLRTQAPSHKPYALKLLDEFPRPSQEPSPAKTQPILGESLTPREIEVLGLMGTGLSNRQIAENLVLSEGTVKFHVHSILEKLQVHSRTAALVRAKELNLI
jgi:LuxR family maltose regulon positive regulatory protein